jgi:hypothetical protein
VMDGALHLWPGRGRIAAALLSRRAEPNPPPE